MKPEFLFFALIAWCFLQGIVTIALLWRRRKNGHRTQFQVPELIAFPIAMTPVFLFVAQIGNDRHVLAFLYASGFIVPGIASFWLVFKSLVSDDSRSAGVAAILFGSFVNTVLAIFVHGMLRA